MKAFLGFLAGALCLVSVAYGDDDPCQVIMKTCIEAGFSPVSKVPGRNLYPDCIKPIMKGETVAGVTIDAGIIAACKAKQPPSPGKKPSKTVGKP